MDSVLISDAERFYAIQGCQVCAPIPLNFLKAGMSTGRSTKCRFSTSGNRIRYSQSHRRFSSHQNRKSVLSLYSSRVALW